MRVTREEGYVIGGTLVVGGIVGAALLLRPSTSPTIPAQAASPQVPQVTGLTSAQQGSAWVLSWTPVQVSGQTVSYTVQRLDTGATAQASSASYSFTSLTANTPVQVTACVGTGSSQICGTPSATYTIQAMANLPAVTGITSTVSGTTAQISWQAAPVQGVRYVVRHVTAQGTPVATAMGNAAAQVTVAQAGITISSLTAGALLHFEVATTLGAQVGPFSAVQVVQVPAAASAGSGSGAGTSGGGGSYAGGNVAQCQALAAKQASFIADANALKARFNTLSTQWQARSAYDIAHGISSDPTLASLVQQLSALQGQINTASAQVTAIGAQMQSLGCF